MSIWSTIGGIAAGIGTGLIAGPAAGIAVGGSIIGKGIQSDQVSKAAKAQQAATDQGLALQQQIYNRSQSMLDPYVQLGAGAVGNLRGLINANASAPSMQSMAAPTQQQMAQNRVGQILAQPAYQNGFGLGEEFFKALENARNQNQSGYGQGNG